MNSTTAGEVYTSEARRARKACGLTVRQVADRLQVGAAYYRDVEQHGTKSEWLAMRIHRITGANPIMFAVEYAKNRNARKRKNDRTARQRCPVGEQPKKGHSDLLAVSNSAKRF